MASTSHNAPEGDPSRPPKEPSAGLQPPATEWFALWRSCT
jgi:hypothetical protein